MGAISGIGRHTIRGIEGFGDFCRFCGRAMRWTAESFGRWRNVRLLFPQMYQVGTQSVPVIMITGAFVGMVLAVQTVAQFKALNMEARMGTLVNLSVLRELGPVLAGVMMAGRIGGRMTAELGTMRVTEQIDALRAMGTDPVRVLVVPRFLASVLLAPVLVVYASFLGILGGFFISHYVYGVNATDFWMHASDTVEYWDIFYGPIKTVFFGAVFSLVCCYKGFNCAPGAAGVGRATTESFVASCMAILGLNFFLGMLLNAFYIYMFGVKVVL
ncbi:MAG: MlaE family ABC transporter permease [Phycisphaerae bacterium]